FSCHNNGDAARALYTAARLSRPVAAEALADTTRWLSGPERWEQTGANAAASDQPLARIQFAAAAVAAFDAGRLKDRAVLSRGAARGRAGQARDGSGPVDAAGSPGSPATYGVCLATAQARRPLERIDARRYRAALDRADRWLRQARPDGVLDAAA